MTYAVGGAGARRRLIRLSLTTALFWSAVYNVVQSIVWFENRPQDSDFRLFYAGAEIIKSGAATRLYDRATQAQAIAHVWPGSSSYPFDNPPPLAIAVMPLTLLPCPMASIVWSAVGAAALAVACWLIARVGGVSRTTAVLGGVALLPAYVAVASGQLAPLIVLIIAVSWRLSEGNREMWAGLVLSALVIKPHIAVLVPLALAFTGRWRLVVTWMVSSALLIAISVALIGKGGVIAYIRLLLEVGTDKYDLRWALWSLPLPTWSIAVAIAGIVCLVAAVAWIGRQRLGIVFGVAVVGSLLVNHHLTPSDFLVLIVPVLALAHANSRPVQGVAVLLWLGAWMAVLVPPAVLIAEGLALLTSATLSLRSYIVTPLFRGSFRAQGY